MRVVQLEGWSRAEKCCEQEKNVGGGADLGVIGLLRCLLDLPAGSDSKESACNVGDLGSIPGLRRYPGGGHGNPLQYSCLENPHRQRSLVSYSPWSGRESDMTEQISTAHIRSPNGDAE